MFTLNKKLLVITVFVAGTIASGLIKACKPVYAKICSVTFTAAENYSKDDGPDRFANRIAFKVSAVKNDEGLCMNRAFSTAFIQSAYATTVCYNWLNDLDTTTFSIQLSKPILYNGDTIHTETDLLSVSEIRKQIEISPPDYECKALDYEIVFTANLVQKLTMDTGIYNARFNCITTDSIPLSAERKFIFREM